MRRSFLRSVSACALAVSVLTAGAARLPAMPVSAESQVLGETSFDEKLVPWQTVETAPARQAFCLQDGEVHITVLYPEGATRWADDLQLRHRGLDFRKDHVYKVSFQAKAAREGMELISSITDTGGHNYYFVLDGGTGDMHMGPDMDGMWGTPAVLTTEYQTFSGEFIPTEGIEAAQWRMCYANGQLSGGNAMVGDEIFFDNLSIVCTTCDDCGGGYDPSFGRAGRHWSGLKNNEISVNQIGYYPLLAKTAVLSDNAGESTDGAERITLDGCDRFELVDAHTEETVYTGDVGAQQQDRDSGDSIRKIDFTEYKTPGEYYIRIKGKQWRSFPFCISDTLYSEGGHNLLTNALNYFYQNRAGRDIEAAYITSGSKQTLAHEGGHKDETARVQTEWRYDYLSGDEAVQYSSSEIKTGGGWYAAPDHGKYLTEGGIAVWTLQNMYERAAQTADGRFRFADGSGTVVIPESDNGIPDILDECRYELDFMAKMKVAPDEPTWGDYAGLYYHSVQDHCYVGLAVKPWLYETERETVRIVKPPTFAATLSFAACAAQAARLWAEYDADYAASLLKAAKDAYQAYKLNWYDAAPDEEQNQKSLYAPHAQSRSGLAYGDTEVRDDDYMAACELFISARVMEDPDADTYYTELNR